MSEVASVFKVAKDLADRTLALPSSYKPAVMGGERDPSLFYLCVPGI